MSRLNGASVFSLCLKHPSRWGLAPHTARGFNILHFKFNILKNTSTETWQERPRHHSFSLESKGCILLKLHSPNFVFKYYLGQQNLNSLKQCLISFRLFTLMLMLFLKVYKTHNDITYTANNYFFINIKNLVTNPLNSFLSFFLNELKRFHVIYQVMYLQ